MIVLYIYICIWLHAFVAEDLDTEGSFRLVTGKTLAESLPGYSFYSDDEDFLELREWFATFGVIITPIRWQDARSLPSPTHPDDMHMRLYNEARRVRGLPSIED